MLHALNTSFLLYANLSVNYLNEICSMFMMKGKVEEDRMWSKIIRSIICVLFGYFCFDSLESNMESLSKDWRALISKGFGESFDITTHLSVCVCACMRMIRCYRQRSLHGMANSCVCVQCYFFTLLLFINILSSSSHKTINVSIERRSFDWSSVTSSIE